MKRTNRNVLESNTMFSTENVKDVSDQVHHTEKKRLRIRWFSSISSRSQFNNKNNNFIKDKLDNSTNLPNNRVNTEMPNVSNKLPKNKVSNNLPSNKNKN